MSIKSTQALSELAEINPRVDLNGVRGDTLVSFIPMSDVSDSGQWTGRQERRLDEVRQGYTPFVENDVLFAKITPCMENGKGAHATGLKNGLGFGSTEFHVLRARGGNDPRFLFHWLQARVTRTKAIAYMGGSAGQQRVQADFFFSFRIPRMDPREQTSIAAVLDTVDEAIAKTEAVIAKFKQVRAGLLHDLLTRGLDEHGQLRDPIAHPEQFKDSPLGRIPREWSVGGLRQLARNCDARRIPLKQADRDNRPGIYPYYGASGVIDHIDDYLFEGEFVLLAEDGENLRSRELPLAFIARGKFWVNNHAHILEPLEGTDIRFLQLILELQDYIPWLIGSAQPKLTQAGIEAIQIKIPPSAEQVRIADALEHLDIQLTVESELLQKFRELKAGLMTDLLTGRVRVPENIMNGGGHT